MPALRFTIVSDYSFLAEGILWVVLLSLACILGDRLCSMLAQSELVWRAMADSATHCTVAIVSWAVVALPGALPWRWGQCLLCGVLASSIDVDHFLSARSWQLKDAVSLQHRPPLHATTLTLAVCGLLWLLSFVMAMWPLRRLALMCAVAWTSHHLRDASRRGLWFPPMGSTPPLPYAAYIAATVGLSLMAHVVHLAARLDQRPFSGEGGPGEFESDSVAAVLVQ